MAKIRNRGIALAAALLALQLAGCAVPDAGSRSPEVEARAVELEALGLRNIAALRVNGPISEGQATYQAERVRFLHDTRDGSLRTWEFIPKVP